MKSHGGNLGPEKKYLAPPPPPNSPRTPSRPLASPPPLGRPHPPPGIFNKKSDRLPSWRLGLPLPLPGAEKKLKNIRKVHQESHGISAVSQAVLHGVLFTRWQLLR